MSHTVECLSRKHEAVGSISSMEGKKVIIKELTIKDIILNESKNG
jgi:hypothetical protein